MIERPDISSCSLTQDDLFKTADILMTGPSTIKTPYQLDLEIMDRKPNIVPKVGDMVRIKSRAWYEKWKSSDGNVKVEYWFVAEMSESCGQVLTVKSRRLVANRWSFKLTEDTNGKTWTLEMFEEVYPQEFLLKDSEEKEPELQTIKRHRFIKLEKL